MRVRNARQAMPDVSGCPVPDKSASCQSIRPVRLSLPAIWSAASGAGTAVSSANTLCGRMPSVRVLQRHLITAMRSGRVKWHEVLSNTVPGRLQTTIGALIVCHSIRPAQVKATLAGRLIWHRTLGRAAAPACPAAVCLG